MKSAFTVEFFPPVFEETTREMRANISVPLAQGEDGEKVKSAIDQIVAEHKEIARQIEHQCAYHVSPGKVTVLIRINPWDSTIDQWMYDEISRKIRALANQLNSAFGV